MTMHRDGIRGTHVSGRDPQGLVLNDGSELALENDPLDAEPEWQERVDWLRIEPLDGESPKDAAEELSVDEAMDLAGDEFAGYVAVRTRAEVEWLRLIAAWYREQADRLARDLDGAVRRHSPARA
jgi:hypothetical protein